MNLSLRTLAALFVALGLAAFASAAPLDLTSVVPSGDGAIRVEPEVQPDTELSNAPPKAARAKAGNVKAVHLSPPSDVELDQLRGARKVGVPLQIGFPRGVEGLADESAASSTLKWDEQADGTHVAAVSIHSPGASALRMGLRVAHIQPNAILRFYGPGDEKLFEVTGQKILDTLARNLDAGETGEDALTYWSPVIESETIVFEIELPADARTDELRIAVPQISHMVTSARTGFLMPKSSAACEMDATCQVATWGSEINAVARMIFTSGGSGFLCTGTLLNDQDPATNIPYFLSANHCISTQTEASTLNTYWFYRSTSCNSGQLVVPLTLKTGGATLLYHSNFTDALYTDTSFMRLLDTPPGGAVYAGWQVSSVPTLGAATTGLHHPGGDLLKISTGNVDSYWNCTPPSGGAFSCGGASVASATFYGNTWTSGITEPGSSGSGLFLSAGRYLIGQLYGGSTGCVPPFEPDIYGRLDKAYNASISTWLGPLLAITRSGTGSGTVTSAPAGISCGATCSAVFPQAAVVTLTATAASDSAFSGWSGGACSGTGPCIVTMNATSSVNAAFTLVQHTLALTLAGTGMGTVTSSPAGISCGATCSANFAQGTVVILTATPVAGSTFSGWTGACTGTSTCTLTMNSALSATATFTQIFPLTVVSGGTGTGTVTSSPAGINCGATCVANFNVASQVTLTATPAGGSTFAGWSGDCKSTGTCTVTINGPATETANFMSTTPPPLFPMTVTRSGTGTGTVTGIAVGIICGAICSANVAQGTNVTLTPSPASGSSFSGWSGACSGTGPCTVTMNAASSVDAAFTTIPYAGLSILKVGTGDGLVTSSPQGVICGVYCAIKLAPGDVLTITLTATTAPGSTFTGWSGGGCAGTGSCIVTVNGPVVVTATFSGSTPPPSALTVTRSGTGTGTVVSWPAGINCGTTCSQSIAWGASVTLSPEAANGSTFSGWSGACSGTGSCIVTMNAASSVDAAFTTSPGR